MKTNFTPYKQTFKMQVNDNKLAFITVEITNRNKYPKLSISGEHNGAHGQVDMNKSLKPVTPLQKKLFKLWKEKHLKEVSAKEQKEIKDLVTALEDEYDNMRGSKMLSELEETEALEILEAANFTDTEKVLALCIEEDITVDEIDLINEKPNNTYSYGGRDYLICTDEEADQAQDEEFENYLDECVLPDLPDNAQRYFDRDAWKADAKHDGRGKSLNRYDGNEIEHKINGNDYFLYRQ